MGEIVSRSRSRASRRLLVVAAGSLLMAACSVEGLMERALEQADGVDAVDFDAEEGSFAIEGEEGEMNLDIDEETGAATFGTHEGEVTTSPTDEVPDEIAAVVDLPEAFQPQARIDGDIDGVDQVAVQGTIAGEFAALMDELQDAVHAGGWDETERGELAPDRSGTLMAENDDGQALVVSLMLPEAGEDGRLHVQLLRE